MTCIVALTDGQNIIMGGDSAGTTGQELRLRADPKVFLLGPYAIGFTTSFRMGQILHHHVDLPTPPTGQPDQLGRFMVTTVVPALRQAFAKHGFAKTAQAVSMREPHFTEHGQEIGGMFLIGVAGRIFEIHADYQVAQPVTPFSAVGTGSPIALGALHALQSYDDLPLNERATKATGRLGVILQLRTWSVSSCGGIERSRRDVEALVSRRIREPTL